MTCPRTVGVAGRTCAVLAFTLLLCLGGGSAHAASNLGRFLDQAQPSELVPGTDRFGAPEGSPPVVPAYAGERLAGYVFLNSDVTSAVGYSGRPIHILVGVTAEGIISGIKLVDHHEPIVLIGIPESKIQGFLQELVGYDAISMTMPAEGGGPNIISGATVTVLVISDSVTRSAAKVARRMGLGGLDETVPEATPERALAEGEPETRSWETLTGDGSVRRLHLSVQDVNEAFEQAGDPVAAARPEPGPPEDTFIDLYVAQVSVPTIGMSLLGPNEYRNLMNRLQEGEHAILVAGRGRYSFKGTGYVRGGIFDRIQLVQGTTSLRFQDRHHKRINRLAAENAPRFPEIGVFTIPADVEFRPTLPWQLQLLVQRATGPLTKAFETFDVRYAVPEKYLAPLPEPEPAAAAEPAAGETEGAVPQAMERSPAGREGALWERIWRTNLPEIAVVGVSLGVLTLMFFFQNWMTRRPTVLKWVRYGFLTFTLVWLGWWANAQLSVVNVLTFTNSLATDFSWEYFLMDPLVFILWFATAAALLFWGRGPFCGWLCPFGALQELTNHAGRRLGIKQIRVPWAVHERLWPIKYIIFLGLFGLALYDLALAEKLSEVEPFKTAIILDFVRDWPFVLYAVLLLVIGLFIERFFCRYLCPLGAALAIPGRIRMFEWLKRWPECGSQCQRCARECPVQSIHPEGHINPNECIYCMHCQELYFDDFRCPHNVTIRLKRERRHAAARKAGREARVAREGQEAASANGTSAS